MALRRGTTRDQKREATRERLFEAALDVFRRDGVEAARIEEISACAGVSRGSFYFHFPSKDDVIAELIARREAELVQRLATLPEHAPLEQVLRTVAEHMADAWGGEPRLLEGAGVVTMRSAAAGFDEARANHPAREVLIPYVERAMARQEVVPLLPADITVDFFLMNLFAMALAWAGPGGSDLGSLLDAFVAFFMRAVRA